MLREEQIDLRRQRAAEEKFTIQNLGRNRVFSEFQVSNPGSGGQYHVRIHGWETGDNTCSCPDFRTNTLGTCKHVEAVLASLKQEVPSNMQGRKATYTRPELFLHYGEQLRLGLRLPPRHSDALARLAATYFDERGLWKAGERFEELTTAVENNPEEITLLPEALEYIERTLEQREMLRREQEEVAKLEKGVLQLDLLKVPLYDYQMRGVLFMAYRGRCILGDDMGLGKTVQTIAAAELMARERGVERVLVVAPASVKYQWHSEILKFTDRSVQIIDGNTEERASLYKQPAFFRLINYELVLRDLDKLNGWVPDLIVLDEAQRIKNWESKISRAVKKLRSRFGIVLTGTPLENKLEELYSIVQFVDDRRLGPAFQFLHDHRVLDEGGKLLGYRNLDKIREKLQPILLRRTRAEVLGQLPNRTDNAIYVEMSEAQRAPYAEQQMMLARLLQKKYLSELDRRRILCCIANMRMLCDSTFLVNDQTNVSPKLDEFSERIRELVVEGPHKVVVFSQWEKMLRKAAEVLETHKIGYVLLHGGVTGTQRRTMPERFRDDPDCRVFLSTDTGGVGLNLQSADTVINLEPPWNPAVLEQRIARVHRLGQHLPVQVLNFLTRDSIEERVLLTLERKKSLFEGVFSGTSDEVSFASLGQRGFLEVVREMVSTAPPAPAVRPALPVAPATNQALMEAGIQFLEALAIAMANPVGANGAAGPRIAKDGAGHPVLQIPLPSAEWLQRSAAALTKIAQGISKNP